MFIYSEASSAKLKGLHVWREHSGVAKHNSDRPLFPAREVSLPWRTQPDPLREMWDLVREPFLFSEEVRCLAKVGGDLSCLNIIRACCRKTVKSHAECKTRNFQSIWILFVEEGVLCCFQLHDCVMWNFT